MSRIARVMARELRRLPRLPVLLALLGPIPLAGGVLLTGVFHSEVARQLPVAILDFDGSQTARLAARWVGAARSVHIVARIQDLGQAEELLVQRKVYAVLVVPRHFERDLLHGRSPRVTLLYNEQYLTAGNLIVADVSRAVNTGASAVAVARQRSRDQTAAAAEAAAEPVRVDARLLFNPGVSYAVGVGLLLIVALMQIVAGISTIYVVGRELSDRTAGEWLEAAGGSAVVAWIGKLAPYVIWDLLLMLVLVGGFVTWFHMPVLGNLGVLMVGALAFSLASKALGVLFAVWLGELPRALGLGSITFGTATAFSGVTFPRIAMSPFAQAWSGFVPLTRFMLVLRDQVMVGAPIRISARPILVLAGTALIAGLLALPRMGRVLRDPGLWGTGQ
jgi:ABC-2 type transport system permease protein